MYQSPPKDSTWKWWYRFALETAKIARTKCAHRTTRAQMAELLNSAHWWLEHRD